MRNRMFAIHLWIESEVVMGEPLFIEGAPGYLAACSIIEETD